jgi:hypothetical protein
MHETSAIGGLRTMKRSGNAGRTAANLGDDGAPHSKFWQLIFPFRSYELLAI